MTLAGTVLTLGDGGPAPGLPATSLVQLGDETARDGIFNIDTPVDHQRWDRIVIHHSGMPAGDADSLHRAHVARGLQGLGYHFVIGNGAGIDDGSIQMGYRWTEQLPGAHAAGESAADVNQHAIAVCLIGNGDRRPFTHLQLRQTQRLVRKLQQEFSIPSARVLLARDVMPEGTSPGRFFPIAQFADSLRD